MPGRYTGGPKTEKQPAFAAYFKKKQKESGYLKYPLSLLYV